jgi:hypothetical protein
MTSALARENRWEAAMHIELQRFMATHYRMFNPLWKIYFPLRTGVIHQPLPASVSTNAFSDIYNSNYWGSQESVSGQGSTLKYTAPLRQALPRLLAQYDVKSILDAPCGDFNWMRHVELADVDYTGGDVVPELVSKLQTEFGTNARHFIPCDILNGPIPKVDLWICRDVLFHFRHREIIKVLKLAASSEIKYLLTTTYSYFDENVDLDRTGGFRVINLQQPPFSLPKPLTRIDDFVVPAIPRYLALWSREQIVKALANAPSHLN